MQEGEGEVQQILKAAEQKIYAIRRGQSAQDMVPLQQVLPEVLDRLSEISKLNAPAQLSSLRDKEERFTEVIEPMKMKEAIADWLRA